MSATVSVWVPLAVAGAGLVTTYGAAILTRWADRRDRREQWLREDSLRWQQSRQQAYARLIGALRAWDWAMGKATSGLEEHSKHGMTELLDLSRTARAEVALVELMASEQVASLARSAVAYRDAFRLTHAEQWHHQVAINEPDWERIREHTRELRKAMRADLGLETVP